MLHVFVLYILKKECIIDLIKEKLGANCLALNVTLIEILQLEGAECWGEVLMVSWKKNRIRHVRTLPSQ